MKKNILKILVVALFSVFAFSCGPTASMGIKQVQINMSKSEVITRMGDYYDVVSLAKTEQGNLEILRYTTYTRENEKTVPERYYYLHFLDGKLVEMNNEEAVRIPLIPSARPPRH